MAASFARRHKVLTSVVTTFLVLLVVGSFAQDEPTDSTGDDTAGTQAADPSAPPPGVDPSDEERAAKPTREKASAARSVRRYAVLRVIDGDTVEVAYRGTATVRVIGIDTPETVSPNVPDECGGRAATRTARNLLEGKRVVLTFDAGQGRRDRYGRLLAYLRVPGVGDYGLAMLKRGRAAEDGYDEPYRSQGRYRAVEAQARQADRNMWGTCGGPDTPLRPVSPPKPATPADDCASGYEPCLPAYPPDLDCADVGGPIRVTGDDPHELDREGDGIACEP